MDNIVILFFEREHSLSGEIPLSPSDENPLSSSGEVFRSSAGEKGALAQLVVAVIFIVIAGRTTAGNSAFLTAFYVVLVPLLSAPFFRRKPDLLDIICAVVAIIAIGLMSLSSFTFNTGDALTLLCSAFFAVHIIALSVFTKKDDICMLTMLQFLFAAAISWILALIFEKEPSFSSLSGEMLWNILFLGVMSSGVAYLFQSFGQKYANAAAAAVLLSTESVFGALFGRLLLNETMRPVAIVGAALMFAAIVTGQTRLSFIPKLGKFFDKPPEESATAIKNAAPKENPAAK